MNQICFAIAMRILKGAGQEPTGAGGLYLLLALADVFTFLAIIVAFSAP